MTSAFGVSGVVTRARGIRATLPDLDPARFRWPTPVGSEKSVYLLDPTGASRRSLALRLGRSLAANAFAACCDLNTMRSNCPSFPASCTRKAGWCFRWASSCSGWHASALQRTVQIWPGMPVSGSADRGKKVLGMRLLDQGVDRAGNPDAGFTPGMDIHAALTVVGDGPVGAVSRDIDRPHRNARRQPGTANGRSA